MYDPNFEKLFSESIKDKGYQFLSDKLVAYYWYLKGKNESKSN